MLIAEEAAKTSTYTGTFSGFDPFIIIFTIIIAIGFIRLLMTTRKNVFAIGFSFIALVVFVIMDIKAISGW